MNNLCLFCFVFVFVLFCFFMQRYKVLNIFSRISQYLCIFYFSLSSRKHISGIFEFLTKFPLEKCIGVMPSSKVKHF